MDLNFLRQDEFVELAVFVGVALYKTQFGVVELLENEHVAEDVPVGDWFFKIGVGPYLSLVNLMTALLEDLELVPVNVAKLCLFIFVHQVLVVVFAQLEQHWAVFFVIIEMATVHNRKDVVQWDGETNGFEVVFAGF